MSKDEFILICQYYAKVRSKEEKIGEALDCEFNGDNTFSEMLVQLLINLFQKLGFSETEADVLEECIYDIYAYNQTCIIDKDKNKKYYLYSYEDVYNDFFNNKS